MRTRRTAVMVGIMAALLPALLPFAGAAAAERPAEYPLPAIKKDCSLCHLPHDASGARLKKPVSLLCLDCHRDRVAPAEHKIDILPVGEVRGLPLTEGRITCVTCHDPHRNPFGSMLRKKETDLCLACHRV